MIFNSNSFILKNIALKKAKKWKNFEKKRCSYGDSTTREIDRQKTFNFPLLSKSI